MRPSEAGNHLNTYELLSTWSHADGFLSAKILQNLLIILKFIERFTKFLYIFGQQSFSNIIIVECNIKQDDVSNHHSQKYIHQFVECEMLRLKNAMTGYVHHAVLFHGGSITASNRPNGGLRFEFTLEK